MSGVLAFSRGQISLLNDPRECLCGCVGTHVDCHLSHSVHEDSSRCSRDSHHGCKVYPGERVEGEGGGGWEGYQH